MSKKIDRRSFLKSASGFALAIPFLPSICEDAKAQVGVPQPPRFVSFAFINGGMLDTRWYPKIGASSVYNMFQNISNGRPDHRYKVSSIELNAQNGISSILGPEFAPFKDKMLFLRGIDGMFDMTHNDAHLGDVSSTNVSGTSQYIKQWPTIDQVIALMRDKDRPLSSILLTTGGTTNGHPAKQWTGDLKNPVSTFKPSALKLQTIMDKLFVAESADVSTKKMMYVDRVKDAYDRLVKGGFGNARRLSSADKNKLNNHMEILFELERKYEAISQLGCGNPVVPNLSNLNPTYFTSGGNRNDNQDLYKQYYQVFVDIIAAAFSCDASRVATCNLDHGITTLTPNEYHSYTHLMHMNPSHQDIGTSSRKLMTDNFLLPLLRRLSEIEEAGGKTALDNSLIYVTDESGQFSHSSKSVPALLIGSAGGYFQTGKVVDYRHESTTFFENRAFSAAPKYSGKAILIEGARDIVTANSDPGYFIVPGDRDINGNELARYLTRHGVPINRFWSTILDSMGIAPGVYERDGEKGYGDKFIQGTKPTGDVSYDAENLSKMYDYQLNSLSTPLPYIKKAA